MKRLPALVVLSFAVVVLTTTGARGADGYQAEIDRARADRVSRLLEPDGWLTLVGLHFLTPGTISLGTAKSNDLVLATGPAQLGTLTLAPGGEVSLSLPPNSGTRVDGREVRTAVLRVKEGLAKRTIVTFGSASFFVIDQSGKKALRVKDSAAERRVHFAGLDYFPVDPSWRIEAQWVPFERARQMPITNILGETGPELVLGKAVFERDGRKIELLAIDDGPGAPLFFVISDATSGKETYAASRFIYAPLPKGDKVVLDFNLAENPPCAFTPFSTCPLPPKENRLPFAVNAGEKTYRGARE